MFTLGRDGTNNDIVLSADLQVSRQHARIVKNGAQWFIEKTAPANSVTVNSRDVSHSLISDGDIIGLGQVAMTTFLFRTF